MAEVQLTADEATAVPAIIDVTYDDFDAVSPSIAAVVIPTCGSPGLLACSEVNGALLSVEAVVTGTASDTPVAGAVVDIVQAGLASGTGASVSDQPCYPDNGGTTLRPGPRRRTGDRVIGNVHNTGHGVVPANRDVGRERRELLEPGHTDPLPATGLS